MASVTFEEVSKRYGRVAAVEGLDLHVEDGEFMVLLGPSGCGKSTALRMIAGLEDITSGHLRIGDRVVDDVAPARRDVSMVFQSYALYPHMSVAKNIESPLVTRPTRVDGSRELRKLSGAERRERLAEAARMLGLEQYLGRKPGELSGGQRQRVALARAVVSRPAVFLMDEPLSNLDAKLRSQTRAELVDLHRRLGTTFVYVTHDQVEAMTMADRVAVMNDGRLQQVGTPREVYDTPANLFVAGFIGTPPMNTALGAVDGGTVTLGPHHLPAPPAAAGRSQPVLVGIRPEHLRIDAGGPVRGTVRQVEWLGHEVLLRVRVDAAAGAAEWIVRLGSDGRGLAAGAEVGLAVDASRVHLFDVDSGARLGGAPGATGAPAPMVDPTASTAAAATGELPEADG